MNMLEEFDRLIEAAYRLLDRIIAIRRECCGPSLADWLRSAEDHGMDREAAMEQWHLVKSGVRDARVHDLALSMLADSR